MSLGPRPRIPDRIIVEKWGDIKEYSPGSHCNICNGIENVKTGQIPVMSCAITHQVFTGRHTQWALCLSCHDKGWGTPKEYYHGIFYFNSKTSESKNCR